MTVREFATQLNKINKYLLDFSPSNKNNKLLIDELMDIAEFSIPATWQKMMIMHGFDPANHTIQEFIEFCERIEFSEGNEQQAQLKETKSQTDQNGSTTGGKWCAKSSERGKSKKAKATRKWCPLHETDMHDASQCKVLLSQAKKMPAQWEVSKGKYSGDPAQYSSSSTSKSKTSTKELFTTSIKDYIQKSVKEAFLSEKKTRLENETFNIEDFEEMELSDDTSSNTKEWLFDDDWSDDMSIPDLEVGNKNLVLESTVDDTNHSANEIFAFRQILNRWQKKLTDNKGEELAPILYGLLQTNAGKIKNSRLTEIKILLDSGSSGCLVKAKK
jgi:hypothetical protein